jgi:hypothetical protein
MPNEPEPVPDGFIPSQKFVQRTGMELVILYFLLKDHRLPTAYINKRLHIDINDQRAKS